MNQLKNKAIDLMIEDLHTAHHKIRNEAKTEQCENELNELRQELLDYLNNLKNSQ